MLPPLRFPQLNPMQLHPRNAVTLDFRLAAGRAGFGRPLSTFEAERSNVTDGSITALDKVTSEQSQT
jgi:hypothetical protein